MKAAVSFPTVAVSRSLGDDARGFLHGLITTDVDSARAGAARFGAAAEPLAKIIVDFLINRGDPLLPAGVRGPAGGARPPPRSAPPNTPGHGGGFLLDCTRALARARHQARLLKLAAPGRGGITLRSLGVNRAGRRARDERGPFTFADPRWDKFRAGASCRRRN